PGDDGKNEMFTFLTASNYSSIRLVITNRWGNVMYDHTEEYDSALLPSQQTMPAWDGTNKSGTPAAEGTYFYYFYLEGTSDDKNSEGQGFLQLIRK
ncbi:gliding motility-associated C-terminal domain-containing protein, partial [Lishizhenia sp.]|uniref:T9SS type B sorting domain-containing protein n=1 Tax=Lishizhenia sp. TaxID=2497594 RepID=UPI00299E0AE4